MTTMRHTFCPACETTLDIDGYCTAPGCKFEGKTPSPNRDLSFRCSGCGWRFTIHAVPDLPAYIPGTDWPCPHCGIDNQETDHP